MAKAFRSCILARNSGASFILSEKNKRTGVLSLILPVRKTERLRSIRRPAGRRKPARAGIGATPVRRGAGIERNITDKP